MGKERWHRRIDFDNNAEIIENSTGEIALVVPDDADFCFGSLSILAWELLHQIEVSSDSPCDDRVTYEFCGVKRCFHLLDTDFSINVCRLFLHCQDQHPEDIADFHAGRLLGMIQRDCFEHEMKSGLAMRNNGAPVASSNRSRAKDPGKEKLLDALKATQPRFAGQKETAIRKAGESLSIKSYNTMIKYIRDIHEIRDSEWLKNED